ncbi:MAG: pantetheine-phosphate adenylyltransferase [Undibacterium umbellatum]|uniref:pantetheine-phosphate adenylyltransferase n=1 Tax=Undibacterium umbellatum TaxID=2762300 RepID=UPI003BB7D006
MKKIAFSGTLDPITNGHLWVIQEARALADEVVVFISENPVKKPQFSALERKDIIERSVAECGWDNVSVVIVKGDYTARAAKRHGIEYLVRGIRNTSDFDYENLIQQTNVDVLDGAKTIFVMPPRDLGSVSSSFVRALQGPVGWHWTVKKFMPMPAYIAWIKSWLRTDWQKLWETETDIDSSKLVHWFDYLTGEEAYGAARRPYHNLDHLVHGLSEISAWASNTGASNSDVAILKKAFWFHDAVYGGKSADLSNEEQSARMWLEAGLGSQHQQEVADLIRVTDHFQSAMLVHPLKDAMLSVDLAILGQAVDTYEAYAAAVRIEYNEVDDAAYRAGRARVLDYFQGLAESGHLFADPWFADLYTSQALINIKREKAQSQVLTGK